MVFIEPTSILRVESPRVSYNDDNIVSDYEYCKVAVENSKEGKLVKPIWTKLQIRTETKVPKIGVMLVGWGGSVGSTFTAAVLANKLNLSWATKGGIISANWLGSISQCSSVHLGFDENNEEVYAPFSHLLPMVSPDDLVISGWDISSSDLSEAVEKSHVIDYDLQNKLKLLLSEMKPKKGIYRQNFISPNQVEKADNILLGSLEEQVDVIRNDMKQFKTENNLQKIVVLWIASTERQCQIIEGINDTAEHLLASIRNGHEEISASTLYAVAAIQENSLFINGSAQNTLVPGCIELAEMKSAFIGGNDLKVGQTKLMSAIVDFLVSAGVKSTSITSFSKVSNNYGKNLEGPEQCKAEEESNIKNINSLLNSNIALYKGDEKINPIVVIKNSHQAGGTTTVMDEYINEVLLGGHQTISMHYMSEDSFLTTAAILDTIVISELLTRISFKPEFSLTFSSFQPLLPVLGFLMKSPLARAGTPFVSSSPTKQRFCVENILKACLGLPPGDFMALEHALPRNFFGDLSQIDHHSNHLFITEEIISSESIRHELL